MGYHQGALFYILMVLWSFKKNLMKLAIKFVALFLIFNFTVLQSQTVSLDWGEPKTHNHLGGEYLEYLTTIDNDIYILIIDNHIISSAGFYRGLAGSCNFFIRRETESGGVDTPVLPDLKSALYIKHFLTETTLTVFFAHRPNGEELHNISAFQVDITNPGTPELKVFQTGIKNIRKQKGRYQISQSKNGGFILAVSLEQENWRIEDQSYLYINPDLSEKWVAYATFERTDEEETHPLIILETVDDKVIIVTERDETYYHLILIDEAGQNVKKELLDFGNFDMMSLTGFIQNGQICLLGLGTELEKAKSYFNTFDPKSMNLSTPLINDLGTEINDFNASLSKGLRAHRNYVQDFEFEEPIYLEDGNYIIVGERKMVLTKKGRNGGIGDILVLKMNQKGGLEWCRRIRKRQHEMGYKPFSSYVSVFTNNKLYLFFNDHLDNLDGEYPASGPNSFEDNYDSYLNMTIVDIEGTVESKMLQDNTKTKLMIQPFSSGPFENKQRFVYGKEDRSGKLYSLGWLKF